MKKLLRYSMVFIFVIYLASIIIPGKVYCNEPKEIKAVYFYLSVCESCNEAEKALNKFQNIIKSKDENLNINVIMYNTIHNYSVELLQKYFEEYNVDEKSKDVPILFIDNNYYYGENSIEEGLNKELDKILDGYIPNTQILKYSSSGEKKIREKFSTLKALNVFLVGLVNGLNPCSFSMLLFLMSLLLVKSVNIKKIGFSFIFGKFIMYLMLGTVMYNLLAFIPTESYMILTKVILGILIFGIALFNIHDYFAAKHEKYGKIKMQLPSKIRELNNKMIKNFTATNNTKKLVLASMLLGMLISIGEFLCTGQLFLTTIVYVLKSDSNMSLKAFIYLLVYVIAFIIPISIIFILIAKTKELFEVSERIRASMPLIKLLTAIVLIILGAIILCIM